MGPEGPKSIAGPARYDKLPQKTSVKDKLVKKTSVKVGKLVVGEGWPAGPSPQACSVIAGVTQQHRAAEFGLLSCCFRRRPARAAKAEGMADPPPGAGQGDRTQHRQQPGLSQSHQPARNSQNPASPAASPHTRLSRRPPGFLPLQLSSQFGTVCSQGSFPSLIFPRAIVLP